MKHRPIAKEGAIIFAALLIAITGLTQAEPAAQEIVTATPARVNLPTALPLEMQQQDVATETPTRTPTPPGPAMVEAITEANVRAEADPDSERLGTIHAGEFYSILGRYYRWIQFQYDASPNGRGWVFDELVNIVGDEASIPDLSVEAQPTTDPATETQAALTMTPGNLPEDAGGRMISAPDSDPASVGGVVSSIENTVEAGTPAPALPTFTYPPNIVALAPTQGPPATATPSPDLIRISVSNGIPPIIPILLLGGFGIFGLVVSSIRSNK